MWARGNVSIPTWIAKGWRKRARLADGGVGALEGGRRLWDGRVECQPTESLADTNRALAHDKRPRKNVEEYRAKEDSLLGCAERSNAQHLGTFSRRCYYRRCGRNRDVVGARLGIRDTVLFGAVAKKKKKRREQMRRERRWLPCRNVNMKDMAGHDWLRGCPKQA